MAVAVRNLGTATAHDVEVVVAAVTDGGERPLLRLEHDIERNRSGKYGNHFHGFWNAETGTLVLPQLEAGSQESMHFSFTRVSRRSETFGWLAEVSALGSYESATKMSNNIARRWDVQRSANRVVTAKPNYSLSMTSSNHAITAEGIQSADVVVTARFDWVPGTSINDEPAMDARVVMEFSPGLQADDDAAAFGLDTKVTNVKQVSDLTYEGGVFNIGQTLDGVEFRMTLPVRVTSGASSTAPLCVAATIMAQPVAGFGEFLDDITDNMGKVCFGPAPEGELEVLVSGTVDLFTWYDCVGKSAAPCDQKDDGAATTNDDLQLVVLAGTAADDFGILQPSQVVVHVPDPGGRAESRSGELVWSTGFENWGSCQVLNPSCLPGDRDRPGAVIAVNNRLLNYKPTDAESSPAANWGTDHTVWANWHTGHIQVTAVVPTDDQGNPLGQIKGWRGRNPLDELFWGNDVDPNDATAPTLLMDYDMYLGNSNEAVGGWREERYIEFSALGTYFLTVAITFAYDDDGDDNTAATNHTDTETYTFHVGPFADLSVAGGASPQVASDRNALTVVAANNGPDNTADAQVKIELPEGALVESAVASEGTFASDVWTLPGLKSRDYRRSSGKPEAATLTLILKDGGGAPDEPATATIGLTDNAYTVCIASDRNTLAHNNRADCKADAKTTDIWHTAVCVKDSDQTVNTSATHDTQAECEALTDPHTWTANICASEDDDVINDRTEPECDGWHTGTVYDPPANNTAKITAVKGTGGGGPGAPGNPRTETGTTTVMWDEVEHLYGLPVAGYEVQGLGSSVWTKLRDVEIGNEYWDAAPTGRRGYRVRAVNEAGVAGPWSRNAFMAQSEESGEPQPPQNLQAKLNHGGSITLTWDAVAHLLYGLPVQYYEVQRWQGPWETIAKVEDAAEYTDFGAGGQMRPYRVRAVNADGRAGPWSEVIDVVASAQRGGLGAPVLRAHTTTEHIVRLTWTEPSNQQNAVTGYELQYLDGDEWLPLAELDADTTEYEDRELPFGAVRSYRVRAWADESVGRWSNEVTAITPPGRPDYIAAGADGPNAIYVEWEPPGHDVYDTVQRYELEVSSTDPVDGHYSGFSRLASPSATARSYTHSGLRPGSTRYYQLRACNRAGCGDWSFPAEATTALAGVPSRPSLNARAGR